MLFVSNKKLMNKKMVALLCSFFFLSGCISRPESVKMDDISSATDEEGKISNPLDTDTDVLNNPNTKFDSSVLLVKMPESDDLSALTADMSDLEIESIKSISPRNEWKKVTLKKGVDAISSIKKFRNSGFFEMVDFDYIYGTGEIKSEAPTTASTLPTLVSDYQKQVNVDKAWEYTKTQGVPGGDPAITVAVIDTGVDYNHIDLKQNIWINKGEIPGNGIDDDGNGYVDDVYGWNFIGNNNNPMDDNGHGTHVAGIIGAANNNIGVTGVAYNCKIMPIKAGNSSGYFNNSDIASAITYAYMNGADVINMSFGGTGLTMAVQDALEKAYTTSFLVAAAGNSGLPNDPVPLVDWSAMYPAALPFVDGVMSVNGSNVMSSFTNWDPYKENKVEYECLAPGENISSTFPGNRYASLSGTSMAAPIVSGIAALLRSTIPDKQSFSSKYLMSQLINTSEIVPFDFNSRFGPKGNGKAKVVDAYNAFVKIPKPDVSLYDWYTFDSTDIDSAHNNGNGNIDAGETIHIGTELLNRGGMAKNVVGTIDVKRNGLDNVVDPYVEIITDTVDYSDIGTYSIRDAEKIMSSDTVVGVKKPFVFKVLENAPDSYLCNINIHITWNNGLDANDTNTYSYDSEMTVDFHKGEYLPARIDGDTTLTSDKLWIVADTVRVGEGVTVIVEPGTTIQFCCQNQSAFKYATPKISLKDNSRFVCKGTEENMIVLDVYQRKYRALIEVTPLANVEFEFCDIWGIDIGSTAPNANSYDMNHCLVHPNYNNYYIINGELDTYWNKYYGVPISTIESCLLYTWCSAKKINNCCYIFWNRDVEIPNSWTNNLFLGGPTKLQLKLRAPGNYLISGNAFVNGEDMPKTLNECPMISFSDVESDYTEEVRIENNTFYGFPDILSDRFVDSENYKNEITSTSSIQNVWPFVSGYQFTNDKGEETKKFSNENMNLKLFFNRAMDTTEPLSVKFGSTEPYADYIIDGTWTDEYTWQGSRQIPTAIENGTQHLRVSGGRAKDDHFLTNNDKCYRISFDIDTTSAMAMNMFATPTKDGIQLEMKQDDYDTVMGYNVYRSETKDGEFVKINTSVVRPDDSEQSATFLDATVEPGKTYYYSYTAVMTDFSESHASGRTACTAFDTINPTVSHTPVNQGYLGSNLNVNCVIRDNVGVAYAKLYYRVKGGSEYKCVDMVSANDMYSGIIPAADLSTDGMEYYIETNDGTNTVTLGAKENPYQVIIKESSAVSYLGDVDGNGIIEAVDAMLVLQHINGKRVLVNDEFRRADLNGNGVLESFEALAILQYVNGNRTNLEV